MNHRAAIALACALVTATFARAADQRHEIRFPDIPGYQTLKCDFHMHTVFSDGNVWPTVRVDEAWREGLDVIAITDHIEYQPHRSDIPTNHNRPHEIAAQRAAEHNLILLRGAEITRDTPPGHYNAILLRDVNPLDTKDFYAVFDAAAAQEAFCFWNHPGWKGEQRGAWGAHQQTLVDKRQLHGIEICNGESYYEYAHRHAIEHDLTLVGTSDIHAPSLSPPPTPTAHRTLTLVFAVDRSAAGVREALFAGRTAVWHQNRVLGARAVLLPLFHACVQVHPPHHRAGNRAWLTVHNRCELDIELERVGSDGPKKINLPAGATTLVRVDASDEDLAAGATYRATNFLVGPDQPLEVRLRVPVERQTAEEQGDEQPAAESTRRAAA